MGGKTAPHPPETTMEPSTLVLTALLQLNEQLRQEDAFCGYLDDHAGTARLLAELWDLYYTWTAPKAPSSWLTPGTRMRPPEARRSADQPRGPGSPGLFIGPNSKSYFVPNSWRYSRSSR
jgi:hypothetical protein